MSIHKVCMYSKVVCLPYIELNLNDQELYVNTVVKYWSIIFILYSWSIIRGVGVRKHMSPTLFTKKVYIRSSYCWNINILTWYRKGSQIFIFLLAGCVLLFLMISSSPPSLYFLIFLCKSTEVGWHPLVISPRGDRGTFCISACTLMVPSSIFVRY